MTICMTAMGGASCRCDISVSWIACNVSAPPACTPYPRALQDELVGHVHQLRVARRLHLHLLRSG
jgi:hypothetical protein